MKKYIFVTILMLAFSAESYAVDNTPPEIPKDFHVYDTSGNTYVRLIASGCSGITYHLGGNHPKYDTIVSVLLTAQTAQREVQLRFDGCNGQGQGEIVGIFYK